MSLSPTHPRLWCTPITRASPTACRCMRACALAPRLFAPRGGAAVFSSRSHHSSSLIVPFRQRLSLRLEPGATSPPVATRERRAVCTSSTPLCLQSWAAIAVRPWMCTQEGCRAVNRPTAAACEQCGSSKPSLRGWKCVPCGTRNYSGVRTCRGCAAPDSASAGFWMCIVCEGNNRVDELEDNSRCGHCGYDMAPHSVAAEERLQRAKERAERVQEAQESYDSISAQAAEEQWGSALADVHHLPPELRSGQRDREVGGTAVPTEPIAPYDSSQAEQQPWRHKSNYRSDWGSVPRGRNRQPRGTNVGHGMDVSHASHTSTGSDCTNTSLAGTDSSGCSSRSGAGNIGLMEGAGAATSWKESSLVMISSRGKTIVPTTLSGPPGFDWMCRVPTCGHINAGDEELCEMCHTQLIPTEWECHQCAALNHLTRACCFSCHSPIAVHWQCDSCSTMTSVYDKQCRQCKQPRVAVEPRRPSDVLRDGNDAAVHRHSSSLDHYHPRRTVHSRHRADSASRPRYRGASSQAPPFHRSDWHCPRCRVLNFSRRMRCVRCDLPRPEGQLIGTECCTEEGSGGGASSWTARNAERGGLESNWICESCQAKNFRTRKSCWQCGTASSRACGGGSRSAPDRAAETSWGQQGWGAGDMEGGTSGAKDEANPMGWNIEQEGFQGGADAKPVGAAAGESSANVWRREGTDRWTCARCYENNLVARTECIRCGAAKTTIVAPRRIAIRKPVKL